MNCKHTKRAVKSLVCGEKADVALIQQHLAQCRRCNERYESFLTMLRSLEGASSSHLDEEVWGEFFAKLKARIRQERPAPLGRMRCLLLWVGQWRLIRFRKALAASAVALALLGSLLGLVPQFWSGQGERDTVAQQAPTSGSPSLTELPPTAADVISIFGVDGFITGVFSGYIQPGDFFGGHELDGDDIYEALDLLLS